MTSVSFRTSSMPLLKVFRTDSKVCLLKDALLPASKILRFMESNFQIPTVRNNAKNTALAARENLNTPPVIFEHRCFHSASCKNIYLPSFTALRLLRNTPSQNSFRDSSKTRPRIQL